MLCADVRSPHLRALLGFEAEQLGLPVRYQETTLTSFTPPPFRREVFIVSHAEYHRERFGVRLPDEEILLDVPAHMVEVPPGAEALGYIDRGGELVPLAAIIRNVLVVFFSLETLAQPEAVLRRRPTNGHTPTQNVLNAVFDLVVGQALPKIKANIEGYDWLPERRRFADARCRSVQTRIAQLRQNLQINDRSIEEKTWELTRLSRKNQELREQVGYLESTTAVRIRRDAEQELVALMSLVPGAYDDLRVEDDRIVARTYPITVTSRDGDDYDLGTFQVVIRLDADDVRITKISGEKPDGYPHPHVSSSGVPCFGNIGAPLAKMLAEGQYAAALSVLLQFLRSYNPGDAYIKLEHFDPDFQDARYDRCYETVSSDDCVDCEDTDCPYWSDRYDRCWENRRDDPDGLASCIRCRECGNHEDAERQCREGASLSECIDCQLPCSHANNDDDMTDCREGSPENCEHCPAGSCSYQGTPTDDEDDESETDGDGQAEEEKAA